MAFVPLSHRLLQAGEDGDISLLRKLIKNKAKAEESTDENGSTPFLLAVLNNHVCAAKLLLEYGSDIEHANNQLHRAVHIATINDNHEMLAFLLSRGAKYDQPNHEGFLPIHLSHTGTQVNKILFNAHNGIIPDEYEQVSEVPVIPTYSIPVPKAKTDKKGKKDKKKKGGGKAKKGKKKK